MIPACVFWISLIAMFSASWLIILRQDTGPVQAEVQLDTTSPCFTTEYTYGEASGPTLNELGESVYGADLNYTAKWDSGTLVDGSSIPELPEGHIPAGTHYFIITDNTTGQIISKKHKVTIGKATLTPVTSTLSTHYFVGKTVTYTGSWTSSADGTYLSTSQSYTIAESDFTPGANQVSEKKFSVDISNISISDTLTRELFFNNHDTTAVGAATVTCPILSTCYSVGSSTQYYGSLNQALTETQNATTATTVVAMAGFTLTSSGTSYSATSHYSHTISGGKTVGSNVTLVIPYKTTGTFDVSVERQPDMSQVASWNTSTTHSPSIANKVRLSGTLTNNGTIEIAGVLGRASAGLSAATSGAYAEFYMESGATLNTTNRLNVYGYIIGAEGATVDAKGEVSLPFVVHDFHGGTHTVAAYNKGKIAPFSIFDMPNIQVPLTCYGGGGTTILGQTDLYANGDHNPATDLKIFGGSDALINLANGTAYFEYKSAGDETTYAKEDILLRSRLNIVLDGDASSGDLAMHISVSILSADVSMKEVGFPISYKINLTLKSGHNYEFISKYHFMPGSVLNIEEGATLSIPSNAGLLFYGSFTGADASDARKTGYNAIEPYYKYYKTDSTVRAVCNLAGTLNVSGTIGGDIKPTGPNAVLNLGSATAVSMQGEEGYWKSESDSVWDKLNPTRIATYTETQVAKGPLLKPLYSNGTTQILATDSLQPLKATQYTSYTLSDGSYAWQKGQATLTFNPTGGTVDPATMSVTVGQNGMTNELSSLPTPTFGEVEFNGWYLDLALTVELTDKSQIVTDTTLYAMWPDLYTVTYSDPTYNVTFEPTKTPENSAYTGYRAINPDDSPSTEYYLYGWSLDGTTYKIGDPIDIKGDCELTAVWEKKYTVTITRVQYSGLFSTYDPEYAVTLDGAAVSATTFYAAPGAKLTVTASNSKTTITFTSPSGFTSGSAVTSDVTITAKRTSR